MINFAFDIGCESLLGTPPCAEWQQEKNKKCLVCIRRNTPCCFHFHHSPQPPTAPATESLTGKSLNFSACEYAKIRYLSLDNERVQMKLCPFWFLSFLSNHFLTSRHWLNFWDDYNKIGGRFSLLKIQQAEISLTSVSFLSMPAKTSMRTCTRRQSLKSS